MRTELVVSMVLLAVVLACGWMAEGYVTRWTTVWVSAAEELNALTAKSAWQRAEETLTAYQARWERSQMGIKTFVKHALLQEMALSMERLRIAIRQQDAQLCAISCMELRENALLLHSQETLSLTNLL